MTKTGFRTKYPNCEVRNHFISLWIPYPSAFVFSCGSPLSAFIFYFLRTKPPALKSGGIHCGICIGSHIPLGSLQEKESLFSLNLFLRLLPLDDKIDKVKHAAGHKFDIQRKAPHNPVIAPTRHLTIV